MEKETDRKCIVTGQIKPKDELLRFVKTPDSRLIPDFNKKIEGRGLYVSNSKQVLKTALEKNLFIKSIHLHLKIEDNERLEYEIVYHWGLIWKHAANATLEIKDGGAGFYNAKLCAHTLSWVDEIYKVRDTLYATIDRDKQIVTQRLYIPSFCFYIRLYKHLKD